MVKKDHHQTIHHAAKGHSQKEDNLAPKFISVLCSISTGFTGSSCSVDFKHTVGSDLEEDYVAVYLGSVNQNCLFQLRRTHFYVMDFDLFSARCLGSPAVGMKCPSLGLARTKAI